MENLRAAKLLPEFPNYSEALKIDDINAASLSEREFYNQYIFKMKPCLVKGAVQHWSAFKNWQKPDYLIDKVGNPNVLIQTKPIIEYYKHRNDPEITKGIQPEKWAFVDFLKEANSGKSGHLVMHGYSLMSDGLLGSLSADVSGFYFLTQPAPPRNYYRKRAFLYKDSYTDWHSHSDDETLMCQVVGTKEVLLLPPNKRTFDILLSVLEKQGNLHGVNLDEFPEYRTLRPYRIIVEAGDGLYIPTCWWHAVEANNLEFGVTVAWCWRSPSFVYDIRLPLRLYQLWQCFNRSFSRQKPVTVISRLVVGSSLGILKGRFFNSPYSS